MMMIGYYNGEYAPLETIRISPLDRGFLFGDGIYEVVPVYDGRAFRLDEHIARLEHSLAAIKIANPHSVEQWSALLNELVRRNGPGDLLLYLQITRGVAPREHAFPARAVPTVFAMAHGWARPTEVVPARVVTLADNRWRRCDIKSIALLGNVLLRQEAIEAGASECILIRDGVVTEGAASNVFVVAGDEVITPPRSEFMLSGITRGFVLELADRAGLRCVERDVSVDALRGATEIWLTSSSMELRPVVVLDDHPVGEGQPGPLYRLIRARFREHPEVDGQSNPERRERAGSSVGG